MCLDLTKRTFITQKPSFAYQCNPGMPLFSYKRSSKSVLYVVQAHIRTHLNARVIKWNYCIKTAISTILSVQL